MLPDWHVPYHCHLTLSRTVQAQLDTRTTRLQLIAQALIAEHKIKIVD